MKSIATKFLVMATCSMFILGSCKKDGSSDPPAAQYDPQTTGSTWTYVTSSKSNADPVITTTNTLTVTGRDTTALGKTYKVLSNSAGPNSYKAKVNGEYYRYGVIPALGTTGVEELYLKDGQDVNASWSTVQSVTIPGSPTALPATLVYTIREKGITKTVNSTSYINVVHVHLDISSLLGNAGSGDFFYSDGVGLIEGSINVSVPALGQSFFSSQALTAYSIK